MAVLAAFLLIAIVVPLLAFGYISTGPPGDRLWYWQNPVPQGNQLNAVSFVDTQTGWAAGQSGVVLKTRDGGVTWEPQYAGTLTDLTGLSFVTTQTGWAAGMSGTMRRTADGGSTWATQTVGTTANLRGVSFVSTGTGVAVGDRGATYSTIVHTSDGGTTWLSGTTTATVQLTAVDMVDGTTGWAVGGAGVILKTTDGGATWVRQASPTASGLNGVSFAPGGQVGYIVGNAAAPNWTAYRTVDGGLTWQAVTGLGATGAVNLFSVHSLDGTNTVLVGANGSIRRTFNGGSTWVNQGQNTVGGSILRAVQLTSAFDGEAVGDSGIMFYTRDGGSVWSSQRQGTTATLMDSSFVDALTGWAVGSSGSILRTLDGGQSWNEQSSGTAVLRGVAFVDASNGWAVGDSGTIRATSDGGNTWAAQTTTSTAQLNGTWFTDASNGWIVGNSGTLLRTTNGGATWTARPLGTTLHLNDVWFSDANNGWIVGQSGRIYRTIDGGTTWATSTSGTTQTLYAVHGVSSTQVWAVGNSGTVVRTTNGGATAWTNLTATTGTTQPLYSVYFTDSNRGWISGAYGTLRTTANSGTSWSAQNPVVPTTGVNIALRGLAFPDATTGFLFGSGGVIRQTTDAGVTWESGQEGTLNRLYRVEFSSDGQSGWASSSGGELLHTRDGGLTWQKERVPSTGTFYGLDLATTSVSYLAGSNGAILRTADGGLTWTIQTSGTTAQLNAVSSADGTTAVAVGTNGILTRTTDGGATWGLVSGAPMNRTLNDVQMVTTSTVFAVANTGPAGSIFKSTDGGATWASVNTTTAVNLNGLHFIDENRGWVVGANVIALTQDGGATWTRITPPLNRTLFDVHFVDADHGWAVGSSGSIFRTADGGMTWVVQQSGTTSRSIRGVFFTSTDAGWVVGDNGLILATTDQLDPVTTTTVSPAAPDGSSGWYVSPATITLVSSKPGVTYYSWSSITGPFDIYAGPLASVEGSQTLYYYSSDTAGRTEPLNAFAVKTDTEAPSAAIDITSTVTATSTATVAWTASADTASGIAHYDVYVDSVYATSTVTTSAALSGLTPATAYEVTVVAVDVAGNRSAASLPAWIVTNPIDTSPLLTMLTANPLDPDGLAGWYVTTPTIVLTWTPSSETGTTYYSWIASDGPYSAYTGTLTPPAGESTLYFSTHADDPVRADEPTRSVVFKVDTSTVTPPSITATASGHASLVVTWSAPTAPLSGIASYSVYLNGSLWGWTTDTSMTVTGLLAETTYTVSARTTSIAGVGSALSNEETVVTDPPPLPAPPPQLLAKAPTGDTAYLNWLPSVDATTGTYYRVWRSADGVSYSVVATTTGGDTPCSYVDTGLRSSTRYWYAVSTVDSRGEGSLTDTLSASWPFMAPTTTSPDRVLNVQATGLDSNVFLEWQPSDNPAVVGYYVYRAPASLSTLTTLTALPTTSSAYFDFTAVNGEVYYYTVRAVDASGAIGRYSVETQAKPIAPYPANQPDPHTFGNESACICHATHSSTALDPLIRFPQAERNTVCRTCHAPSTSQGEFTDPLLKSKHPMGSDVTTETPYTCVTCHVPLVRAGDPLNNLMRVNSSSPCVVVTDTPAGNQFCYSCHGSGSTLPMGDLTVFETSGHRNVPAPATGANIQCDTCHESHSSRNTRLLRFEGYMACMQCHTASAANPDQPDILSLLTLNEGANTKHPLLPQDQVTGARMECQNCHNTHTTSKDFPLVDPHNPSPAGTWLNPRTDEKSFCFRCHDGDPLPTSVETSPWANPVLARSALTTTSDTEAAYLVNTHGLGYRADSTTTTAFLRPDMGYSYQDVLECRACHDPHGTVNNDAILDTVLSADGTKRITGVLTYKIPTGGKDFRYFCSTCHVWSPALHDSRAGTSTVNFPVNCKSCHGHSVVPNPVPPQCASCHPPIAGMLF